MNYATNEVKCFFVYYRDPRSNAILGCKIEETKKWEHHTLAEAKANNHMKQRHRKIRLTIHKVEWRMHVFHSIVWLLDLSVSCDLLFHSIAHCHVQPSRGRPVLASIELPLCIMWLIRLHCQGWFVKHDDKQGWILEFQLVGARSYVINIPFYTQNFEDTLTFFF